MKRTDGYWDIYTNCLDYATKAGTYTLGFWTQLIDDFDRGNLDFEAARTLISRWREGTQRGHILGATPNVSRAQAYRLIEQWRPVVKETRNPGTGA